MFSHYDAKLQAFLGFVLSQYVKEGVGEPDQAKLPHLLELKYRAISDAAAELGGVARIREAFVGFQAHLYALTASGVGKNELGQPSANAGGNQDPATSRKTAMLDRQPGQMT